MKKYYLPVVIIFMLFFVYEYLSPILNSLSYGQSLGWSWQETILHKQVIKHILRLPLYGLIYLWIFINIPKKSKNALVVWRIVAWLHLIFKPIFSIAGVWFATKTNMFDSSILMLVLPFIFITIVVYSATIFVVEKYWREINQIKK